MKNQAIIVVGVGYGDEGKGTMVDYLVRKHEAKLVVRFSGGAQARHHVVLPDGRTHGFSQFGSGTFAGASTFLSVKHLFDPLMLGEEARILASKFVPDPLSLIRVDELTPVVNTFHVLGNRIRELCRGSHRHGSCGLGIWEADNLKDKAFAIRAHRLRFLDECLTSLRACQQYQQNQLAETIKAATPSEALEKYVKVLHDPEEPERWCEAIRPTVRSLVEHDSLVNAGYFTGATQKGTLIFEGSQGILIDGERGFRPFVAGTGVLPSRALNLLTANGYSHPVLTLGVTRHYMVRHGPGPLPTEAPYHKGRWDIDRHNTTGQWQGDVRYGYLDIVMLNYALANASIVALAVTCMDQGGSDIPVCDRYRIDAYDAPILGIPVDQSHRLFTAGLMHCRGGIDFTVPRDELPACLQRKLGVPVKFLSHGPTHNDKTEL